METVFDVVIDIVESYKAFPQDFVDINELMYHRKQLSTYSVTMATEIGDVRKEMVRAESKYEIAKNEKKISYSKMGTTKAEWYARVNTEELLNDWKEKESLYWKLDYVFRAVKEVLSEMNQRISYLKDEEKQTRFHGND